MFRLPRCFMKLGLAMAIFAVTLPLQAQNTFVEPTADKPVSVSAELKVRDGKSATLIVYAKIADGFHIYAQSQPKPFIATRIKIEDSVQFKLTGPFTASMKPHRRKHPALDVELHEFERAVSWSAPVKLTGADFNSLTMKGYVFAQTCTADRCLAPRKYLFTAKVTQIKKTNAESTASIFYSSHLLGEEL